jgi:hypothetical protein
VAEKESLKKAYQQATVSQRVLFFGAAESASADKGGFPVWSMCILQTSRSSVQTPWIWWIFSSGRAKSSSAPDMVALEAP